MPTVHERWVEWSNIEPPAWPHGDGPAVRVPAPLRGPAFFPGGYGLTDPPSPSDPDTCLRRPVMVVAHNFGTAEYHRGLLERGVGEDIDRNNETWGGMNRRLDAAGVKRSWCFFTNVYVGLRPGQTLVGSFPGAMEKDFRLACRRSLLSQMSVVCPRVLVVLGMDAVGFMATSFAAFRAWRGPRGGYLAMSAIDKAGMSLIRHAQLADGIVAPSSVALYQPSERRNLRHRRWGDAAGEDAEIVLLRQACAGL